VGVRLRPSRSSRVSGDSRAIPAHSLTYDDGPNCSHNAFYDYLQEQNQKGAPHLPPSLRPFAALRNFRPI